MTRQLSPQEAYDRLADRAAMAELCSADVIKKLRDWSIAADVAGKILNRLTKERFVDDRRFAALYVRDRLNNARWGLIKIRANMRLKRLSGEIIEEAIDAEFSEEQYFSNLAAALRSKARNLSEPLTAADRAKLIRFAAGRGYEPELILDMIADEEYWRNAD